MLDANTAATPEPPRHYVRLNRFVGLQPERLAESLQRFGEEQLPTLARTGGFRTLFFGVDYAQGRAAAATFWESEAHLRHSERAEGPMRELALARAGGQLGRGLVDSYQIIFEDQGAEAGSPAAAARLARWEGVTPSRISDAFALWERDRLPQLRDAPGYRGIFVAANMLLGNTLSVTLWDSTDALRRTLGWERSARQEVESDSGLVPRAVLADSYVVALAPELRSLPPWPAWGADALAA